MVSTTLALIGRETPGKPFPMVVHENAHLFAGVRSVLDVGAGRGRFARYFLLGEYIGSSKKYPRSRLWCAKAPVNFVIEEYVAVEPHEPFCEELRRIGDARLRVICTRWEDARAELRGRGFDMVILWDVLMFIPLDPFEVLSELIEMTREFFLFSLHPVENVPLPKERFKEVLAWLDSHPKLELIGKKYLNRVYRKRP